MELDPAEKIEEERQHNKFASDSTSLNGNVARENDSDMGCPEFEVEASDCLVVQNGEGGEPMELPVNKDDNSLGMSTLTSAFPGSHGLKFKNPKTGASRALMMDSTGSKFLPPPDGWEGKTFTVIFPASRGAGKRRKVNDKVLSQEKHKIDGRRVEIKIPDTRSENFRNPLLPLEQSTSKVFVGRLPETTADELRSFFEAEAMKIDADAWVTDCFIPRPFRGFGFVNFSTCRVAIRICVANNFSMKGVPLAVSLALPRGEPAGMGGGPFPRGGPMRTGGDPYGVSSPQYWGGSGVGSGYGFEYGGERLRSREDEIVRAFPHPWQLL